MKKLANKPPSKEVQWCTDIEAQRIIENREETIRFATEEIRRLKKEIIELKLELENIGPAMKRQQETIVRLNEQLSKQSK